MVGGSGGGGGAGAGGAASAAAVAIEVAVVARAGMLGRVGTLRSLGARRRKSESTVGWLVAHPEKSNALLKYRSHAEIEIPARRPEFKIT